MLTSFSSLSLSLSLSLHSTSGNRPTFDDIATKATTIDRAAFQQICSAFQLAALRQKKRLNAQGERIEPNADGWYKLWSLLPSNEKEIGWDVARDIRVVNVQEITRAATGEPGPRRGRRGRGRSDRTKSDSGSIRFGQTVETTGVIASIDVLPDDVNTPPTISDNGEIPMTANSILQVFNSTSGAKNNFLGLTEEDLGQAISSIAYDGVRRLIPAEHLIQAEMKRNTARLAFFRQVLPEVKRLKWKAQFRHLTDYPGIADFYDKSLRRTRREARTHYTRSHHVFARVTQSWLPDVPTQRVAATAFKRFFKGSKRDDGTPYRLFQEGGMELHKDDVVHVVCRRTTQEHEEHLENLRRLDIDPKYGLSGPGRFPERDLSGGKDLVRKRPGDWYLGLLISYKGELVEEGTMSGWFPASCVEVVKIENELGMYEDEAAEMMQAAVRGTLARNRNRDRWDAVQTIQKIGRGMIQRRRFERAKYVLRGVAEAIISKRLMSLTKAQCAAAVFNRMKMGAQTQLRRRIMENNHGFAFGESNSSSVKWRIDELENDQRMDEKFLMAAAEASMYPADAGKFGHVVSIEEHREIQKNRLLFTKTRAEMVDDLRNDTRTNRIGLSKKAPAEAAKEENEMEVDNNGLDEDESNWLDSIGAFFFISYFPSFFFFFYML